MNDAPKPEEKTQLSSCSPHPGKTHGCPGVGGGHHPTGSAQPPPAMGPQMGPSASLGLINEATVWLFQAVSAHYHPGLLHPVPGAGNGTGAGGSKAPGCPAPTGQKNLIEKLRIYFYKGFFFPITRFGLFFFYFLFKFSLPFPVWIQPRKSSLGAPVAPLPPLHRREK